MFWCIRKKSSNFFENIFFDHPAELAIHNYSGKSKEVLTNKLTPYGLNNKINVVFTDNSKILAGQDFIYAYIVRKFVNNFKIAKKNNRRNTKIKNYIRKSYYPARSHN